MSRSGEEDPSFLVEELGETRKNLNNINWEEQDVFIWSKKRLIELFTNFVMVHSKTMHLEIEKCLEISGKTILTNRENELNAFYDLNLAFHWIGEIKEDGRRYNAHGEVKILNLNDSKSLDEISFEVSIKGNINEYSIQFLEIFKMKKHILKERILKFIKELKNGANLVKEVKIEEKEIQIWSDEEDDEIFEKMENFQISDDEEEEDEEDDSKKYSIIKQIAIGSTATVYLAKNEDGEFVAIKKILVNFSHLEMKKQMKLQRIIQKEIEVLSKLGNHPNIVNMKDLFENRADKSLNIVFDYIEGDDLFGKIEKLGKLDENLARKYFKDLIEGLEFCHKSGICHRDLKPENLLIDSKTDTLKIIDFGVAGIIKPNKKFSTYCGTENYCAPEILLGKEYDGVKADLWSCGAILYSMLTGAFAFDHDELSKLIELIVSVKYTIPNYVSKEAADLIKKLLVYDPNKRCTILEIKNHKWYKQ